MSYNFFPRQKMILLFELGKMYPCLLFLDRIPVIISSVSVLPRNIHLENFPYVRLAVASNAKGTHWDWEAFHRNRSIGPPTAFVGQPAFTILNPIFFPNFPFPIPFLPAFLLSFMESRPKRPYRKGTNFPLARSYYIFIICIPSVSVFTIPLFTEARAVLTPKQSKFFSHPVEY